MSEKPPPFSLTGWLRGLLFEICFSICCRLWYPGVPKEEIAFVDTNEFHVEGIVEEDDI